jgi:hypothetical protein
MIGRNYRIARLSFAVAVALVAVTVSGMAQQTTTFKAKHTAPEKPPKSTVPPGGNMGNTTTASAANSKDLQSVERETAKPAAPTHAKKTSATTPALIPAKEEPTPPNNSGNSGGTVARKSTATAKTKPDANPYRGRLREKYASHQSPN